MRFCVRNVSFFSVTLLYFYSCGFCWFDTIGVSASEASAFALFVGADLKIGTKEKPIKVKSQFAYWWRIYYECNVYFPCRCQIEIVPYLRTYNVQTHAIHFVLTWKSHSFQQIKKKCDFYVQYICIVYVRFRISVVREWMFCMWLREKWQRVRDMDGKETWKSSSCQLLNKPNESKMNRIVAHAHTHIIHSYLFHLWCAFILHLGRK